MVTCTCGLKIVLFTCGGSSDDFEVAVAGNGGWVEGKEEEEEDASFLVGDEEVVVEDYERKNGNYGCHSSYDHQSGQVDRGTGEDEEGPKERGGGLGPDGRDWYRFEKRLVDMYG